MNADIVDLQALFGKPVSYRIPQFQRPYAWKRDEQWKPLWDDVVNIAEHWLGLKQGGKMRPHFMGAIVLQRQDNNSAEVEKRLVVDGQQRLTTLQLLIRAAQEAFSNLDDQERATRLRRLTSNEQSYWGGNSDNETKIRQSNVNDQRAFQGAIRNGEKEEGRYNSGIRGAYGYLSDAVNTWLNADPEQRTDRMNALEEAFTKYMQIAAIDLDEDEQPHTIFETLNARGEPLKQSDLIKNTVMYEAKVVDDSTKAGHLWGMFDSNDWWRDPTKEGRLSRIHIDRFLNYWMVVLTRKDVTAERVASAFREYINPKDADDRRSIEDVVADIRKAAGIYHDMEETRYPGIETFLGRMKAMEIGVVMPLLLWLYTSEVQDQKRLRCVNALESYLVRRMLCGLSSNGLNRLFLEIMERIGPDDADEVMVSYLKRQTLENRIWPNDRMVSDDLAGKPMRGTNRPKMVMEAIEMRLRSELVEPLGDTSKLTLEHIMPQKWANHWPLPQGVSDRTAAGQQRDEAVKAVGNFTLTSGKLNTKLSNGNWDEKRRTLDQHTALFINKELLANAPAAWDEAAIWERSRHLADMVVQIWPSGENF